MTSPCSVPPPNPAQTRVQLSLSHKLNSSSQSDAEQAKASFARQHAQHKNHNNRRLLQKRQLHSATYKPPEITQGHAQTSLT